MAQSFSFTLDSFEITTTRSLIDDTDWVSFTLVVNPQGSQGTPQTLVKSMGAINNGIHTVDLAFENIDVNPTDTVVLNYLIVNYENFSLSGNAPIENTMASAGALLATLVTVPNPPGGDIEIPQLSSALPVLSGWLSGEFYDLSSQDEPGGNPIGFPGCDGAVAAEQDTFDYQDLLARTSDYRFDQNTVHSGSPSPEGCGTNSRYVVNWHIANPRRVCLTSLESLLNKQSRPLSWRGLIGVS